MCIRDSSCSDYTKHNVVLYDILEESIWWSSFIKAALKEAPHSKSWNWSVRYNAAIDLLKRVLPYMKHPEKIRRAKLLVLHYKEVTNRGGHYTTELLRRKHKFERAFFCRSTKTHV